MKTVRITSQKAAVVVKKWAYEPKPLASIQNELLLKTGAKLKKHRDGSYHLAGYAWDGSDLSPILGR